MKIINLVSAHTGNDLVNHGFEMADGIIGIVLLIIMILITCFLIKKYKNKRNN